MNSCPTPTVWRVSSSEEAAYDNDDLGDDLIRNGDSNDDSDDEMFYDDSDQSLVNQSLLLTFKTLKEDNWANLMVFNELGMSINIIKNDNNFNCQ